MGWTVGDRVTHPARSEWGVGVVKEVRDTSTVRVWFERSGEKLLKDAPLERARGADAARQLRPPKSGTASQRRAGTKLARPRGPSIQDYRTVFIERFPKGFRDPNYVRTERAYKVEAGELLEELLSAKRFRALLRARKHDEICDHAQSIINATNLVFPNEKMRFSDGLRTATGRERFGVTLFELLYGNAPFQVRFEDFVGVLDHLDAAIWTVVTYFPFLAAPDKHMFLKPVVSKRMAAACGIELNYASSPNWRTYASLLLLCDRLEEELADLKPRDRIDLQSFLWCVAR